MEDKDFNQADLKQRVDAYTAACDAFYALDEERQAEVEDAMESIQDKLDAIAAKYKPLLDERLATMQQTQQAALEAALTAERSIKGDHHMVVYTSAHVRVSWNTDKLDGLAALIPQINTARTQTKMAARAAIREV